MASKRWQYAVSCLFVRMIIWQTLLTRILPKYLAKTLRMWYTVEDLEGERKNAFLGQEKS